MLTLLGIGLLAGVIAGLSPCVLPVLPAIFASTVSPTGVRRRPVLVVGGLVLSFSVALLLGSALLSALGLPASTLTDIGVAALAVVGLSLVWPWLAHQLERPFQLVNRLGGPRGRGGSGFVLGMSLGLVFVPCAGPVLAAVTTLAAAGHLGGGTVLLTIGYGLGVAGPLLVFAQLGERLGHRATAVRLGARRTRSIAGVVLLASAVAIGSGALAPLQRALPGYTSALQSSLENSGSVRGQLQGLVSSEPIGQCLSRVEQEGGLASRGCRAPEFQGISHWLNTTPLTLAGLRGRVVLVDFWTYSCINCQRTLPHLAAWQRRYAAKGLTIVGVHTPEFAFEHDVGNIRSGAHDLGVTWPIAVDNSYATWNAYANAYWPAEYLIDQRGVVRHVHFGEGGYGETDRLIAQLLDTTVTATGSDAEQPQVAQTAESYLGYDRAGNIANSSLTLGAERDYRAPEPLPEDSVAFAGRWTVGHEAARAGRGARLLLRFRGAKVNLVLAGSGTIGVSLDGRALAPVHVSGVPTLYVLYDGESRDQALLTLDVPAGISAYDFTFG